MGSGAQGKWGASLVVVGGLVRGAIEFRNHCESSPPQMKEIKRAAIRHPWPDNKQQTKWQTNNGRPVRHTFRHRDAIHHIRGCFFFFISILLNYIVPGKERAAFLWPSDIKERQKQPATTTRNWDTQHFNNGQVTTLTFFWSPTSPTCRDSMQTTKFSFMYPGFCTPGAYASACASGGSPSGRMDVTSTMAGHQRETQSVEG